MTLAESGQHSLELKLSRFNREFLSIICPLAGTLAVSGHASLCIDARWSCFTLMASWDHQPDMIRIVYTAEVRNEGSLKLKPCMD